MIDTLSLRRHQGYELKPKRHKILVFILLLPLLLNGCIESFLLTLAKGSTNKNIVFYISDQNKPDEKMRLTDFTVYRAKDIYYRKDSGNSYPPTQNAMWRLTSKSAPRGFTDIIVYGKNIESLKVEKSALPIEKSESYWVSAFAKDVHDATRVATFGFVVEDDGKAREMNDDEYKKIYSR